MLAPVLGAGLYQHRPSVVARQHPLDPILARGRTRGATHAWHSMARAYRLRVLPCPTCGTTLARRDVTRLGTMGAATREKRSQPSEWGERLAEYATCLMGDQAVG